MKEQNKLKESVRDAESAYNSQNTQFGKIQIFYKKSLKLHLKTIWVFMPSICEASSQQI